MKPMHPYYPPSHSLLASDLMSPAMYPVSSFRTGRIGDCCCYRHQLLGLQLIDVLPDQIPERSADRRFETAVREIERTRTVAAEVLSEQVDYMSIEALVLA